MPALIATRIPQRAASVSVGANGLDQAAMDVAFVGATSVAMLYALPPLLVSRTSAFPQGPPLALVAVPAANHRHGLQSSRTGALIQIMHHAVCRHGRAAGFSGSARARYPQHGFLAPCGAAPFLVGARLRANKPTSTGLPDQLGPVDCDADLPGQGRQNRSGLPSRGQRCRAQRIFERSRMLGPATMNLP